ncbi:MAG: hypothetical protein ACI9J2_000906 [Saprospiraceae bacterium]|jgi:hypothetical protein
MHGNEIKIVDTALKLLAHDDEVSIRINGVCIQPFIRHGALISVCKKSFYWPGDI